MEKESYRTPLGPPASRRPLTPLLPCQKEEKLVAGGTPAVPGGLGRPASALHLEPVRDADRHHGIDRVIGHVLLDLRLLAVEEDLEGLAGDRRVERAAGRNPWRQGGLAL